MRFRVLDCTFPRDTECFLLPITGDQLVKMCQGLLSPTHRGTAPALHPSNPLPCPSLHSLSSTPGTGSELASGGGAEEGSCWHKTTVGMAAGRRTSVVVELGDKGKCWLYSREGRSSCWLRGDRHHAWNPSLPPTSSCPSKTSVRYTWYQLGQTTGYLLVFKPACSKEHLQETDEWHPGGATPDSVLTTYKQGKSLVWNPSPSSEKTEGGILLACPFAVANWASKVTHGTFETKGFPWAQLRGVFYSVLLKIWSECHSVGCSWLRPKVIPSLVWHSTSTVQLQISPSTWGSSSSPSHENKTSQLPMPPVARPTNTAVQHQRLHWG